jgi:hypothetical protein
MIKSQPHGERGAVLISAIYTAAIVAAFAVSLHVMTHATYQQNRQALESKLANYVAEGALHESYARMVAGGAGDAGSAKYPVDGGTGAYWVESSDLDTDLRSVIATADVGNQRAFVEMIVSTTPADIPIWGEYALFGDKGVLLDSGSQADSYDSRDGNYGGSNKFETAHVGSNDDVVLKSGSTIYGDATAGPDPGDMVRSNGSHVTGNTYSAAEPTELPEITVPSFPNSGGYSVDSGTKTLAAGDYHFSSMYIENSGKLTVTGPANVVVDYFFMSGSELVADTTNGPVNFYCTGDVSIESGSDYYPKDEVPGGLIFHITSKMEMKILSGSRSIGVIYAPKSKVIVDSGSRLYGAVVASELELLSGSRIHFDLALAGGGGSSSGSGGTFEVLSWRVLSASSKEALDKGIDPLAPDGGYSP